MAAQIRIGTSGLQYKHWCGPFYPKKCPSSQWFELYARLFDTVEVNNTFYRLPTEDALRNWHDAAPRKFCFSVKASRFITHVKRLRDPADAISLFFSRVELLRSKVGSIDRKSTRLNSSHQIISYAVFCLKKKNQLQPRTYSRT